MNRPVDGWSPSSRACRRPTATSAWSAASPPSSTAAKIVLVGRNGAGKTTLLKALLAESPNLDPVPADRDAGTLRWGHEVAIGYFPRTRPASSSPA